jgi:hypothetical protein
MTGRPLVAAPENVKENGMEHVRENVGRVARNVEVWIFGAFAGLVLAACLDQPAERTESSRAASLPSPASQVGVAREPVQASAQPQAGFAQPMYVVYVTGKRPSLAEKRAARAGAG